MKAVIFLNPTGVDLKVLDSIKVKLENEGITPVMYESEEDIKSCDFV